MAVDCPSGLLCDGPTDGRVVQADSTLTFHSPKLSFFLPGSGDFAHVWHVLDIGLRLPPIVDGDSAGSAGISAKYLTPLVESLIRPRAKFSHKGTYGHLLLVGGSRGKMGAAVLAATAALREGVGLVTAHVPACGVDILQVAVPQAMVVEDAEYRVFSEVTASIRDYSTVALGPGLGTEPSTKTGLYKVLSQCSSPVLLDADALNILAANTDMWSQVPPNSVITPHPKEFERLFGPTANAFERLKLVQDRAHAHKMVIVLKGAHTAIVDSDGSVHFNTTGGPWLAQAGSGDRLTGMIGAWMAMGYRPIDAARIAVYRHGAAEFPYPFP